MTQINSILAHTSSGIDFSFANRLNANAAEDCCCSCVNEVLEKVKVFFAHCIADVSMLWGAFAHIHVGAENSDIDMLMQEVMSFRNHIINGTPDRALRHYSNLGPRTRTMFHLVDEQYVRRLVNETDPAIIASMIEEVIRECNQIASYRTMMIGVNTFFQTLFGGSVSVHVRAEPVSRTSPSGPSVVGGMDVAVPDTVTYVQHDIPTEIQNKADEITRLKDRFGALANPPAVPPYFNCPVLMDIMAIPVFDASHPVVQQDLFGLRNEVITLGALNARRDRRHAMEMDALEQHIASGRSWAPAKCPTCRHPEHGGIRREYLRIDTGLQNEILAFLRNAVGVASR